MVQAKIGNFGYTKYAANTLTSSDGTTNKYEKNIMNYLKRTTNTGKSMANAFINFQSNLSKYYTKLKAGDWCLADQAYETLIDNTTPLTSDEVLDIRVKSNGTGFYYDSRVRLAGKDEKEPTLKCNGTNMDKFNSNTDMYVGTLTVDELVYAGSKIGDVYARSYLINDYQTSNFYSWWTLSPSNYYSNSSFFDNIFYMNSLGNISYSMVTSNYSFRPAISLKADVIFSSGDGTKDNAYKIK